MLLEEEYASLFIDMERLIENALKTIIKIRNHRIFNIGMQITSLLQKLPVNNFEWIKDTSQFNEVFIETIINKVMKDIFRNLMFNILKD